MDTGEKPSSVHPGIQWSLFQNLMVCELEVVLEDDEEDPEANRGHFGKRDDSGFIDTVLPWSIQACNSGMNQVLTYCNNGVNIEEQPKAENSEADRVPGPRRRRPRTQYGLSAWQKKQLESVFQTTPYPDLIVRKTLARMVFLGESTVRRWFKKRRAKYRKYYGEEMLPTRLGTWGTRN